MIKLTNVLVGGSRGRAMMVENKTLTIEVVRSHSVEILMLWGRSGQFVLNKPDAAFLATKKALRAAVWEARRNNWRQKLTSCHDNTIIRLPTPVSKNG